MSLIETLRRVLGEPQKKEPYGPPAPKGSTFLNTLPPYTGPAPKKSPTPTPNPKSKKKEFIEKMAHPITGETQTVRTDRPLSDADRQEVRAFMVQEYENSIKGTVVELGRKVKAKYPGAYDDLSDAEVGRAVKAKNPGAYDDFKGMKLTFDIEGDKFTADWKHDRDPTPQEIDSIEMAIRAKEGRPLTKGSSPELAGNISDVYRRNVEPFLAASEKANRVAADQYDLPSEDKRRELVGIVQDLEGLGASEREKWGVVAAFKSMYGTRRAKIKGKFPAGTAIQGGLGSGPLPNPKNVSSKELAGSQAAFPIEQVLRTIRQTATAKAAGGAGSVPPTVGKGKPGSQTIAGVGGSPWNDALRAKVGSLAHAMHEADQKYNWSASDPARAQFKADLERYERGDYGATKRLASAKRGQQSLLWAYGADMPNYRVNVSNEAMVNEARSTVHEGAKNAVGGALSKLPGGNVSAPIGRAVTSFATGAVDPFSYRDLFEQATLKPVETAEALKSSFTDLFDSSKDLETRALSALNWITIATAVKGKVGGFRNKGLAKMSEHLPTVDMTNAAEAIAVRNAKGGFDLSGAPAVDRLYKRMIRDGHPATADTVAAAAKFLDDAKGNAGVALANYFRAPGVEPVPAAVASTTETAKPPSIFARLNPIKRIGYSKYRKPDYGLLDRFMAPLSILDADGNILQQGTYARIGGAPGSEASQVIRNAERAMTDYSARWGNAVDDIDSILHQIAVDASPNPKAKLAGPSRQALDRVYEQFVDLVELPRNDPRRNVSGALGEALEVHDAITEALRGYIIEARNSVGLKTPKDWGVTEKGYFRHVFLADFTIYSDGQLVGRARTYVEAQKMAFQIRKSNPNAKVYAEARSMGYSDPAMRQASANYFKEMAGTDRVHLTGDEMMADLDGVLGRTKRAGFLLPRNGAEGFSRQYAKIMRTYAAQVARSQELTRLDHAIKPTIHDIRTGRGTPGDQPLPGLADEILGHVNDLWGIPSKTEQAFGEAIRKMPILNELVAAPDFALRGLSRRLTEFQYLTKLRFNIKSAAVNVLQPMTTLWPYTTTKEFAGLYLDFLKPATRQMLQAKGVLDPTTKIEGIAPGVKAKNKLTGVDPFREASAVNRGVGYLFGYRKAIAAGKSEAAAHNAGLSWAERCEFSNDQFGVQPILRSPEAKVLGQFKAFQGKNLEQVFRGILAPQPGDTRLTRAARAMKFLTAQGMIGGVKGAGLVGKWTGAIGLGKMLEQQLRDSGMNAEDARALGEAVVYGAPSLLGVDLSMSVAIFEEPYGYDPAHKAVNLFAGPTFSNALALVEEKQKYSEAKTEQGRDSAAFRAGKAITPLARTADVIQQLIEVGPDNVTLKAGHESIKLTRQEAIMLMFGFQPMKASRLYDSWKSGKD